MQRKEVDSVSKYIGFLTEVLVPGNEYLFRGHPKIGWVVSCSAARRLGRSAPLTVRQGKLQEYHAQLLTEYQKRDFHIKATGQTKAELDLLGEIQHHDGATGLIDFTCNALVALWFASEGEEEDGGEVFVLNLTDHMDAIAEVTPERARNTAEYLLTFREFATENPYQRRGKAQLQKITNETPKLWHWTPALTLNERVFAQHSCFLFGLPVIPWEYFGFCIRIAQGKKRKMCSELELLFDIDSSRLFADFQGYSRYCHHYSLNVSYDSESYASKFKDAVQSYRRARFGDAIKEFGDVIDISETPPSLRAMAYLRRGISYRCLEEASLTAKAISDFNEVIEMGSDVAAHIRANAYGNRGAIFAENDDEENIKKAILDFTEIIATEGGPTVLRARAYFYRALNRCRLPFPQINDAIDDYTQMFATDDNIPSDLKAKAYINRGICWSRRTDLSKRQRLDNEVADYKSVFEIDDAPVDLKKMAREYLEELRPPTLSSGGE